MHASQLAQALEKCGESTEDERRCIQLLAEVDGQRRANGDGAPEPAADDLRSSALNELKTSAYASATAKRSEVDYNRAQAYVHTKPTRRPVAEAGRGLRRPEA